MLAIGDNIKLSADSIRAHKLRASLTVLGLTMGVATLITVMTIVQGANIYVEQKIANLGTNVFRVARTPFAVTDFTVVVKALRHKNITPEDMQAVAAECPHCQKVGASVSITVPSIKYKNNEIQDGTLYGYTANMVDIDTRTVDTGRYFTDPEDRHAAPVCLIGNTLVDQFFEGASPLGRVIRVGADEFTVIGTFEKIGAVLGQEQDNFVMIPMNTYLRVRGSRTSLTLEVKASGGQTVFQEAQDEASTI